MPYINRKHTHTQQYFEYLNKLDPIIDSSRPSYVMVSRVSILLRGLGTHVGYPVRVAVAWRSLAEKALKDHKGTSQELKELKANGVFDKNAVTSA